MKELSRFTAIKREKSWLKVSQKTDRIERHSGGE